jgi:hypothetical protein
VLLADGAAVIDTGVLGGNSLDDILSHQSRVISSLEAGRGPGCLLLVGEHLFCLQASRGN